MEMCNRCLEQNTNLTIKGKKEEETFHRCSKKHGV